MTANLYPYTKDLQSYSAFKRFCKVFYEISFFKFYFDYNRSEADIF